MEWWPNNHGAQPTDPDYLLLTGSLLQAPADTTATKPTLTIAGLTVGHNYRLQLFSNAPRGGEAEVERGTYTLQPGDHVGFVMLTATWTAADDTLNMRWIAQATVGDPVHFSGYALHEVTSAPPLVASISSPAPNGDVTITFDTVSGLCYKVEYTDSLPATSWAEVVPGVQKATGTTMSVTDPEATHPPGSPQRFYRVAQVTCPPAP